MLPSFSWGARSSSYAGQIMLQHHRWEFPKPIEENLGKSWHLSFKLINWVHIRPTEFRPATIKTNHDWHFAVFSLHRMLLLADVAQHPVANSSSILCTHNCYSWKVAMCFAKWEHASYRGLSRTTLKSPILFCFHFPIGRFCSVERPSQGCLPSEWSVKHDAACANAFGTTPPSSTASMTGLCRDAPHCETQPGESGQ